MKRRRVIVHVCVIVVDFIDFMVNSMFDCSCESGFHHFWIIKQPPLLSIFTVKLVLVGNSFSIYFDSVLVGVEIGLVVYTLKQDIFTCMKFS
jgi:hypothetical protein